MEKKLTKSANKSLAGVCGGIAEYFDGDPTVIRLVFVIAVIFAGCGLLAYLIAWIIMPEQPGSAFKN